MNNEPNVMPILDADKIIPGLWQGSYPGYGRSGAMDEVEKYFDILVLCADELHMIGRDADFPKLTIMRVGLDDREPPRKGDLEKAEAMAEKVAIAYRSGKRVLVTCAAGLNRSGLVTALALRLINGKSGNECADIVQSARKDALYNRYFNFHVRSLLLPNK